MLAKTKQLSGYLAQFEIGLVAFFVIVSMVFPGLLLVAVIGSTLLWGVRWWVTGRPSIHSPINIPVVLLLLTLGISLTATHFPEITIQQILRVLLGVFFLYALINTPNKVIDIRWTLAITLIAALGLSFLAPMTVDWTTDNLFFIPRSLYTFFDNRFIDSIHPNVLAGVLSLLIPFTISWLLFLWREIRILTRIALSICLFVIVATIILTQSRGAWIALFGSTLLLVMLRWRRGWIASLAIIVSGIIFAGVKGITPVVEFISTNLISDGVETRLEIWSRALSIISDYPLTGIGMGSFQNTMDALYPLDILAKGRISHAHNLFLQISVDLGIPGLLAFLAIFSVIVILAWRIYRYGMRNQESDTAAMGAGLLASQLVLLLTGLSRFNHLGDGSSSTFIMVHMGDNNTVLSNNRS